MTSAQSAASARFARFVSANREPLLVSWEIAMRERWPEEDNGGLRSHVAGLLDAAAGGPATPFRIPESGLVRLVTAYQIVRGCVRDSLHRDDDLMDEWSRFSAMTDHWIIESVSEHSHRIDTFREALIAMMGHDLRTPLHAITLLSHLMSRAEGAAPELSRMARQIAESADALNLLVRDALDFTRARIGTGVPVSRRTTDLEPLCREAINELKLARPERAVDFRHEGATAGEWDHERIRRVVVCLLTISSDAGSGMLDVSLDGGEQQVVLAVRCMGARIPDHVMEPPPVPHAEHHGPPERARIAIWLARDVVAAHGGTIELRADPAESMFLVTLPRHSPGSNISTSGGNPR